MVNTDVLYYADEVGGLVTELKTFLEQPEKHHEMKLDGDEREQVAVARQHLISAESLLRIAAGAKA